MTTRTQFEYVAPITYGFDEASFEIAEPDSAPGAESDSESDSEIETETDFAETVEPDFEAEVGPGVEADASQNDLGYFMSIAAGYRLLTAEDECSLGLRVWRARARLLRILRRAGHPRSDRPRPALEPALGARPATTSTRRRLARVEALARSVVDGGEVRLPAESRISRARLRGARTRLARTLADMDEARRRLVEHNLRLVVWVAKRFRGRGFDFIDLIQEGSLGLMRAAERYDPRVGARFSTFATHWIQQGIRRALAEKARPIRIPVNRIPEVRQALYLRGVLSERLGRAPRAAEIAAEMNVPTSKVEELLPAIGRMDSIDAPIPMTDKMLGDTLEDSSAKTPLESAIEEETRRTVKAILDELPHRQRIILSMRHGIGYPHECTLDEIGDALGLSRERIRQVEKIAVASVRDWMLKHRRELAGPM